MTELILDVQAFQHQSGTFSRASIESYRRIVHSNIDLLTPDAVEACQSFLGEAYAIADGTQPPEDANKLKNMRRELYESLATYFGLEKMMPWMTSKKSQSTSRRKSP